MLYSSLCSSKMVILQVFSLDRTSGFADEMHTSQSSVPFFVKDKHDFEQKHPAGRQSRQALYADFHCMLTAVACAMLHCMLAAVVCAMLHCMLTAILCAILHVSTATATILVSCMTTTAAWLVSQGWQYLSVLKNAISNCPVADCALLTFS